MGVVSTVLLSAGVLRHYWDIYVHRTVRGISFIFVGIDAAGDVFSLTSVCEYSSHASMCKQSWLIHLVFQPKLDILGMVIYATEFVLWCGVFACGGYFNLTPWVKRKMSTRAERKREEKEAMGSTDRNEEQAEGVSRDIELERLPSSTSVFRTPSSVASLSKNAGHEGRVSD